MIPRQIFISYSRKDEAFALEVYERLTVAGFHVWIDQRSIRPGMSYAEEIVRALEQATAVILLFTEPANQSPEIHKEIQLAANRRLPILPVRLADVTYHPALAYHLAAAQWIDGTADRRQAIDTLIDHLGGETTVSPSAPAPATRRKARRWMSVAGLILTTGITAWFLRTSSSPSGAQSSIRGADATPTTVSPVASTTASASPAPVVDGPRIAVMYFDFGGGDNRLIGLRKGFADMMVTDLRASGRLNLVERERLEEVLNEIKLQRGAAVDPGTAIRIGKLLGAEYLVFGSYFELFGTLRVDAKLVRVESGQITTSQGVEGPMSGFSALQHDLTNRLLGALAVTPSGSRPTSIISTEAVMAYSKILDEVDAGRTDQARTMLQAFRTAHPDFAPAQALVLN